MNRRLELTEFGQSLELSEKEIPTPPPEGLVVKVSYCGVCHSDVHMAESQLAPEFAVPRVLGHEISGEIFAMGKDAAKADKSLSVGTSVVVFPWIHCNNCGHCRHGSPYCPGAIGFAPKDRGTCQTPGIWIDGGFQQYIVLPTTRHVIKVKGVDMDAACLSACGGVTGYSAVMAIKESVDEAIKVNGSGTILLVGGGGVCCWAIQFVRVIWGAKVKVVVVDRSWTLEGKVESVKQAGADDTATWDMKESPEAAMGVIQVACGGFVDGIIDFTGTTPTAERVFYCLSPHATWAIVGLYAGLMPPLPIPGIVLAGLNIKGVYAGTREQVSKVLDLLKQGKVKPPPITSISLEEVNDIFEKLKNGKQRGRAVIQMPVESPTTKF